MKSSSTSKILKVLTATAAGGILLLPQQASAHVSYGKPLYDPQGAAASVLHLTAANQVVTPSQTTTASSNAGYLESHNATYWGNSHDSRFMWFSIDGPTLINFSVTGNANNPISGTYVSGTPSTLQPAYNLFSGVVPYVSHDGAYQPNPPNTGFASWSSWAWAALPTANGGTGNVNAQGNLVKGVSYVADAGALNGQAGLTIDGTGPGVTSYMGVIGSVNGLQPGDTVTMSNNVSQATYADGTPLTQHSGTMTFLGGEAAASGNTLNSKSIYLTTPGVYTLQIAGANQSDYDTLLANAMATGMGGYSGFSQNTLGLYAKTIWGTPNTIDTQGGTYPLGIPVMGFFAAADASCPVGNATCQDATNTGPGSSYANSWRQVEQYSKLDRAARGFSISFTATPVPVPAAVWLFGSALGWMGVFGRRKKTA